MKKALAILLVCLSSTVLFAQTLPTHWTPVATTGSMTYSAVVTIDGVEVNNSNIEIGAFVVGNEGVCRGANRAQVFPITGRYIFSFGIFGVSGEQFTFKLYDWTSEQELDLVSPEPLTYVENNIVGNAFTPYVFAFTTPVSSSFEKEIAGYGTDEGHWYLIASPVGEVAPGSVGNMVYEETDSDKFDLYCFDQSQEKEWLNYKGDEVLGYEGGFSLEPGKGYLYASKQDTTLVFNGQAYTGSGEVALTKTAGAEFEGWNLVGNPFAVDAFIGRPFYRMNTDNTEIMGETSTGAINAMEGVFVIAENDGEEMTFTTTAPNPEPALALNLIESRGKVIDRAIVSFGKGQQLPKFQIFKNSTKVYIPMDGNDYALVRSEGMGEMPVNFKAESNGTYSLTLSSENVDFAYLHLIDNMTGADQNLLANPSYSFSANTTDYASRFRLVFATGNDEDNFAFFSNGSLFINNEGNATLQVVDVTGRIIKCENINGCASVNINAASGVYMVRLINGDNMKVQKVVK